MLGSYHEAMAEKFEQFGAKVHVPTTLDREQNVDNPEFLAFRGMTSKSEVDIMTLQKGAEAATG